MTGDDDGHGAGGGPGLPVHGQVCYLQIPAADPMVSAQFYETVFGWHVERPHPSFTAPGLIGQWVDDRRPAADSGLLAWINVDSIDQRLADITANGGAVVDSPYLDEGVRWLATARDPAGNTIGLVQLGQR